MTIEQVNGLISYQSMFIIEMMALKSLTLLTYYSMCLYLGNVCRTSIKKKGTESFNNCISMPNIYFCC